jgi:isochorismate synthase EntC
MKGYFDYEIKQTESGLNSMSNEQKNNMINEYKNLKEKRLIIDKLQNELSKRREESSELLRDFLEKYSKYDPVL